LPVPGKVGAINISKQAAEEIKTVSLIITQNQGYGRVMKGEQVKYGFDLLVGAPR
jgi:hypothetical protein